MTVTDTLARDNGALEINTGTIAVPVWTPVGGLNTWSPSPEKNSADTTKFSNQGRKSHLVASRGDTFTFGGFRQVDEATGVRDAGQLACEALGDTVGQNSLGQFRHSRAGGKVSTFMASATVTDGGGGNDDPDAWQLELEMSGSATTTSPAGLASVVTSVVGTPGTGEVEITWTDGVEVGDLFEITIFDGAAIVKQAIGSEQPVLIQLAADSYTAAVRARNDAGWSALSTASSSFTVS